MLPLRLLVRASWCTGGVALAASRSVAHRPAPVLALPRAVLRRGRHTAAPGEENDSIVRASPRSVQYKFNKRVRRSARSTMMLAAIANLPATECAGQPPTSQERNFVDLMFVTIKGGDGGNGASPDHQHPHSASPNLAESARSGPTLESSYRLLQLPPRKVH